MRKWKCSAAEYVKQDKKTEKNAVKMSKDTSFPTCVLRRLVRETPTIDLTQYKIDLKINSSVKTPSLEYMPVKRPRLWATMWCKCLDWVHFSTVLFPFKGPLDIAVKYIESFCLGT